MQGTRARLPFSPVARVCDLRHSLFGNTSSRMYVVRPPPVRLLAETTEGAKLGESITNLISSKPPTAGVHIKQHRVTGYQTKCKISLNHTIYHHFSKT